jgi:Arc/MetJ family transcription regulator
MKTTIELDGAKLERVMALLGAKTRREAVDLALSEAERLGKIRQVLSRRWTEEEMRDSFDPAYDVLKLREREIPGHGDPR